MWFMLYGLIATDTSITKAIIYWSNDMNILIIGEIGVGKSTLLRELLGQSQSQIFGFRTEKTDDPNTGLSKIYIHPALGKAMYSEINVVGKATPQGAIGFPSVFNNLGTKYLKSIPDGSIVLMDELGYLESNAVDFCDAVLRTLDGPNQVFAAVRREETPFLQTVRGHRDALVYRITTENRSTLCKQILFDIQSCTMLHGSLFFGHSKDTERINDIDNPCSPIL